MYMLYIVRIMHMTLCCGNVALYYAYVYIVIRWRISSCQNELQTFVCSCHVCQKNADGYTLYMYSTSACLDVVCVCEREREGGGRGRVEGGREGGRTREGRSVCVYFF